MSVYAICGVHAAKDVQGEFDKAENASHAHQHAFITIISFFFHNLKRLIRRNERW